MLDERINSGLAGVARNVAGLQFAKQHVDEGTVADLDGDLCEVLVGTVHRVTGLECGNGAPALLFEHLAGLCRAKVDLLELGGEVAFAENLHRTSQVHVFLLHDHCYAGMLEIGSGVDLLALILFIDLVLLGHLHGGHDLAALFGDKGDLFAVLDAVGLALGSGEGDRNRPESAVGHFVLSANAFPVVFAHEAFERSETADAHHDKVTDLTGGDADLGQALCLFLFGFELISFEEERLEDFVFPMRVN